MNFHKSGRRSAALVALATASTLVAAGCSAGSLGSAGGEGSAGAATITFLHGTSDTEVASAKAVIEAFQAANPNITVKHETRPGGSEGDNLVKTRLATGDMADVFIYNNGSLLPRSSPRRTCFRWTTSLGLGSSTRCFRTRRPSTASSTEAVGHRLRRRGALQHSGLREARPARFPRRGMSSWRTTRRSRRRQGRPGRADLRGDMDVAVVRARRLPQRRGRGAQLRRGLHR